MEARPDNTFAPQTITIDVGDTVTFRNAGGYHDVTFEDANTRQAGSPSIDSWVFARRFPTPGTYAFYCSVHGGPGGAGMSGKVVVNGPPPPPPDTTVFSARPLSKRFKPGAVLLRVHVSQAVRVTGTLERRRDGAYRRVGSVRIAAPAGRSTVRVAKTTSGKRVTAGAYRLTLRAIGKTATLRFSVRRG